MRYRTVLHQGFQSLKARPLYTVTAVDVCRTLKRVGMDSPTFMARHFSDGVIAHHALDGCRASPSSHSVRIIKRGLRVLQVHGG